MTRRDELWAWLAGHPVVRAQPALTSWVSGLQRAGLARGSVARVRHELTCALHVVAELPASGIPLPVFADDVLGETHALDEQTLCAGLVLRALAAIHDVPPPVDAQQRRALWERAGVAEDELSSTGVIGGRVPGRAVMMWVSPDPAGVCWAAGEAAVLTLRQVRTGDRGVTSPAMPGCSRIRAWSRWHWTDRPIVVPRSYALLGGRVAPGAFYCCGA